MKTKMILHGENNRFKISNDSKYVSKHTDKRQQSPPALLELPCCPVENPKPFHPVSMTTKPISYQFKDEV